MRLFPQPPPERIAQYYPDTYWHAPKPSAAGALEEVYRRFVLGDHVRFVERSLRESREQGPVLDVGCGGGLFLALLKKRGFQVMGLDFSQAAASVAWQYHGVPVVCGSLSQSPIPPGHCAAVTMFHVLEHLYDPRHYLDVARDLLRPEGRLIIQVPNAACWQFLMLGEAWSGLDVPRHLIDFRAQDIELLLESCGFEVIRRKFFSLRDNPAGLATSVVPSLDPMARTISGRTESAAERLWKDLVYFGLVVAAVPLTLMEAACRAGSTIMLEARKKP